jgi:hypothetical protein
MGWGITLTSIDKPINPEDVESSIKEMPKQWRSWHGMETMCDDTMWHCEVDVFRPKGMELYLHGAYSISGLIAEPFAKMMALLLEKRGYVIDIGEMS